MKKKILLYFGYKSLTGYMVCEYFLSFYRLESVLIIVVSEPTFRDADLFDLVAVPTHIFSICHIEN